jgi:hypothetical protein
MAQGLLAPARLQTFGLVNHTHSATAQLLDDAAVRDALADQLAQNPASVKRASQ